MSGLRLVEMDEPTWVYNAYCEHFGLLYTGIANDMERRIRQHRSDKPWWPQVDNIVADLYPTRRMAREVEAETIWVMQPLHNVAGVRGCRATLPHEIRVHTDVWRGMRLYTPQGEAYA